MIIARIAVLFIKTTYYGLRLFRRSSEYKIKVKKQWAEMVLKSFGFELKVLGIPPKDGAFILVGNHVSYLDIPVLMAALPETTFIAKDDLRRWPIIGGGAKAAGTLFVSRSPGSDRTEIRKEIFRALKEKKQKIAIFPSGTTTLYEQVSWRKGAFEIAKQTESPICLFRLDYEPLRASAYIDDDNLLNQMARLLRFKKKNVTLTWMGEFNQVNDPVHFSEELRLRVAATIPESEISELERL